MTRLFATLIALVGFAAATNSQSSSHPTGDGCGSVNSLATPERMKHAPFSSTFAACCNAHDPCWGTLGASKSQCDSSFKACLHATCKNADLNIVERLTCPKAADTYAYAVSEYGSKAYDAAQAEAYAKEALKYSKDARHIPSKAASKLGGEIARAKEAVAAERAAVAERTRLQSEKHAVERVQAALETQARVDRLNKEMQAAKNADKAKPSDYSRPSSGDRLDRPGGGNREGRATGPQRN
jgi:hypothetical protein